MPGRTTKVKVIIIPAGKKTIQRQFAAEQGMTDLSMIIALVQNFTRRCGVSTAMRSFTPQPPQVSVNNFGSLPLSLLWLSRNMCPLGQAVHLPQVPLFLPLTFLLRLCFLSPVIPALPRPSTTLVPPGNDLAACSPTYLVLEVRRILSTLTTLDTCQTSADLHRVTWVLASMVRRVVTLVLRVIRFRRQHAHTLPEACKRPW